MADVFSKAKRSEVMSRIRSRGNKATELALAKFFRRHKITGGRRQRKLIVRKLMVDGRMPRGENHQTSTKNHQLAVRPDFVFQKIRLAVFVDGCFWHGCPRHATQPKDNRAFWRRKFAGNKKRAVLVTRTLRRANWRVLRLWEHTLRWAAMKPENEARLLRRIQRALTF